MTPNPSPAEPAQVNGDCRRQRVLAAQVRLLYGNANVGAGITLVAASILGRLQWELIAHPIVLGWCLYMALVAGGRLMLARRYWRSAPSSPATARWLVGFAVVAGLTGTGWGAAGILLYPDAQSINQVFVVFIVGGMMLGAASIFAARPEAYLAFIVPAGLLSAARLVLQGDQAHVAMALMASLFSLAIVITTRRIHLTIASSLNLQFENASLVEGLRAATHRAEALNAQLELRVQERTAELHRLTQQLRAEIAERRRTEEHLRELESQLRTAIVKSPLPALLCDEAGAIRLLSRGWTDRSGYLPEELPTVRDWIRRAYGEQEAEAAGTRFRQRFALSEAVHDGEGGIRTKDGGQRSWDFYVTPLGKDRAGTRLLMVQAVDLTERKAAEAALRESEQRFRELAENISEVFWMSDLAKNQVLYVSPAYEPLWGRSCESLYAAPQSWLEAVHPEDRERVWQAARTRQVEGAYNEEYRIVRPDGAVRWVRDRAFPVRGAAGQMDRVVGVARDVTAHKEAEAELQRREAHFRSLIENASDLITVVDAEGRIGFQSPSVERVLGHPPAEFAGCNAFDWIHPEDAPRARAALGRALSERAATVSVECRFCHRDGRWRLLQTTGRALPAGEGEGLVVLNSRDVTEQKELEAQLRQAQKMEAVGQLAGGVAHDFNNLLSVIFGHSELLEMRLPAGEPLRDSVVEIGRASERAAGLTRQLLAFSRQQVLEPQLLDLNAVVAAAENLLRRLIGEDVRLTTKLQPDLSPVRADPGQLDQVILNLAVNARDAMPHGGTLTFETRNLGLHPACAALQPELRPGRHVLLAVTDTGCGMSPEVQARIFEPFFTTKGVGKGTGLGLAVVHGIVEQSGGHLEVCSLPGVGTTFKVYLPAVEAPATAAFADGPAPPPAGRGETVLLVEDEDAVRAVSVLLLESLGYRVLEAASAEEALRLVGAGRHKLDLLLTDVVMPGRNGRELAEALRRQDPGLKVLFQSGYTGEVVVGHGVVEAETAFVQKPFTLDALAKKVRAVLDAA